MKRHNNLFDKIVDKDNLLLAYKKAKKHKSWQQKVIRVEKDLDNLIEELRLSLINGTYKTIDTTQTITGVKSFNKTVNFNYYTNFNYAFTVDVAAKFNNQIRIKDGQSLVWLDTNDATLASINKSNYTGNANTATKLEIARTINGIAFDGSADITIPEQVQYGTTDLTAGTSSLATGRIYCVYE